MKLEKEKLEKIREHIYKKTGKEELLELKRIREKIDNFLKDTEQEKEKLIFNFDKAIKAIKNVIDRLEEKIKSISRKDIKVSNFPDKFDIGNLPEKIKISNFPKKFNIGNLPEKIKVSNFPKKFDVGNLGDIKIPSNEKIEKTLASILERFKSLEEEMITEELLRYNSTGSLIGFVLVFETYKIEATITRGANDTIRRISYKKIKL